MMIHVVKSNIFQNFFWTSSFDGFPFLCQLRYERVIYLKRKPYYPLLENIFETGQIFARKVSRQILVKEVLFERG